MNLNNPNPNHNPNHNPNPNPNPVPNDNHEKKTSLAEHAYNVWSGVTSLFSSTTVDTGPNTTGGGKKQKKRKVGKSKGRTLRKGKSNESHINQLLNQVLIPRVVGGKKQKKRKVGKSKGRTLRKGKSSGRKGKTRGRKSHSRKH